MRHKVTRARQAGLCRKIGVGSVLALSAGAVGACADSTLDDLPIRTDSAGVSIVHYPSLPSVENSRLAIADEPELTLGHEGGEPAYEFFTIAGVVRLGDGSLVVANAGTMELRVFSPDGRFLGAFGGRGEGPGELSFMRGLWITGGDSLVVWDGQSKFNLFSPSGEFVRTGHFIGTPFTGFRSWFWVRGVLADGRVIGSHFPLSRPTTGVPERGTELLAFTNLAVAQWDSVRVTPSDEMIGATFGPGSFASAAGSTVALVDGADFRIELYDASGHLFTMISASFPDIPVTSSVLDAYVESFVEQLPAPTPEVIRDRLYSAPLAPVLPKVRAVFVDSDDRIWVERFDEVGSPKSLWEVFERDGTWIGRIGMPDGFVRHPVPRLAPGFSERSERFSGVWMDPDSGVETVRVYRVHQRER